MAADRTYQVKEIFGPTIQGEGPHAGWPCRFVRLAGCNAWDGRRETRAASACPWCDTDFRGGEALSAAQILARLASLGGPADIGLVLTGGEPLLQADAALIEALAAVVPWLDIETNGTRPCPVHPANLTVVCSPKAITGQPVVVAPDAWKVLIPDQEAFLDRAQASGRPVWVQPTCPDAGPQGTGYQANLARCLDLCRSRGVRLSLQLHKLVGVP
jgi:7-carboxy-7-deazaguanine synthase